MTSSPLSFATEISLVKAPPTDEPAALFSLDDFVRCIPLVIAEFDNKTRCSGLDCASPATSHFHDESEDPILRLFKQLDISQRDRWHRYAFYDPVRLYTRNLIATDHTNYALILLCWNPGRESPIHDHPGKGCWMKVLQGCVQEQRFVEEGKTDNSCNDESRLRCIADEIFYEGQAVFIDDSLGYHKIGNPSSRNPAVTLHLYCPPIEQCQIWSGVDARPRSSCMSYYSEYGCKVE